MALVVAYSLGPGRYVIEFHESLTGGVGVELHVWGGWAWLLDEWGGWLGGFELA